jgi:hypothetical protein
MYNKYLVKIALTLILLISILFLYKLNFRKVDNFTNNNEELPNPKTKTSRVIYNILPLLNDTGYIGTLYPKKGVSNSNIVYTRSLKSNIWKGPIKNSTPNNKTIMVDLTYGPDRKLYGIGMALVKDNAMYDLHVKEEANNIKSKWVLVKSNENIMSVMFDIDNILIGCHAESGQIYKKKSSDINSEWYGPINYDIPMRKITYDKDGYLLGIGFNDNKIYKKKGFFWMEEEWDTVNINNQEVYDLVYDTDGSLIATTKKGIMKQKIPNYMSAFEDYKKIGDSEKKILSKSNILKLKTGLVLEDENIIDDKSDLGGDLKEILKFKSQALNLCKNKKNITSSKNMKNINDKILLLNTQNDMIDKLENMVKSLQESLEPKVN